MKVFAYRSRRFTRRRCLIWHSGIALLLSTLSVASALACTPPPGGLPVFTVAQRVRAADVVLEGTVTQMTAINMPDDTATISVQRYFKSTGPASVTITGFGPTSLCRSPVHAGEQWIFYAKGDPSALMSASYLSQFDAVDLPSADTIAQIIAALNMRPRAYLPLLAASPTNITAAPASGDDGTLVSVTLLLVILGVLLLRRHLV